MSLVPMIVTIFLMLLLACSVMLVCIAGAILIDWTRQLRTARTRSKLLQSGLVQMPVAEEPMRRGYDSDELFLEDRELREIAPSDQASASLTPSMLQLTGGGGDHFHAGRVSAMLARRPSGIGDN